MSQVSEKEDQFRNVPSLVTGSKAVMLTTHRTFLPSDLVSGSRSERTIPLDWPSRGPVVTNRATYQKSDPHRLTQDPPLGGEAWTVGPDLERCRGIGRGNPTSSPPSSSLASHMYTDMGRLVRDAAAAPEHLTVRPFLHPEILACRLQSARINYLVLF